MLSGLWVSTVTEIVGRETRKAYRHLGLNTCVHSSRVLHTVLRREGIRSEPAAVSVMALDAVSLAEFKAGLPMSGFMYYVGPDAPFMPQDPTVKVLSGKAWNAHMVCTVGPVAESELIVADVTAPQFSRPQHGVTVEDSVTFDAEPDIWSSGGFVGANLPGGGGLVYRRLADDVPESQAWRTSSAWTKEGGTIRAIADRCLREIARLDIPREVSPSNA